MYYYYYNTMSATVKKANYPKSNATSNGRSLEVNKDGCALYKIFDNKRKAKETNKIEGYTSTLNSRILPHTALG